MSIITRVMTSRTPTNDPFRRSFIHSCAMWMNILMLLFEYDLCPARLTLGPLADGTVFRGTRSLGAMPLKVIPGSHPFTILCFMSIIINFSWGVVDKLLFHTDVVTEQSNNSIKFQLGEPMNILGLLIDHEQEVSYRSTVVPKQLQSPTPA